MGASENNQKYSGLDKVPVGLQTLHQHMTPWEYMLSYSDVLSDGDSEDFDNCRLKILLSNMESLLINFKELLDTYCAICPPQDINGDTGRVLTLAPTTSAALGYSDPALVHIVLEQPGSLSKEFMRTFELLNHLLQKDDPSATNSQVSSSPSACQAKETSSPSIRAIGSISRDPNSAGDGNSVRRSARARKVRKFSENEEISVKEEPPSFEDHEDENDIDETSSDEFFDEEVLEHKPSFQVSREVFEKLTRNAVAEGALACPGCLKVCSNLKAFVEHIDGHCICLVPEGVVGPKWAKVSGKFVCLLPDCQFETDSRFDIYEHHQNKHHFPAADSGQHECPKCEKIFKLNSALVLHLREGHQVHEVEVCHLCDQVVVGSFKVLENHLKTSHRAQEALSRTKGGLNKYHICEFCSKRFRFKKNLIGHLKIHHAFTGLSQLCQVCGKTLKSYNCLRRHMAFAHGLKVNCRLCKLTFQSIKELQEHRAEVHGQSKAMTILRVSNEDDSAMDCEDGEKLANTSSLPHDFSEDLNRPPSSSSSQDKPNSLYKASFAITEKEFQVAMSMGRPFKCPACEKLFQDKKGFFNHLDGKCFGIPLSVISPRWKREGGKFHCLFHGCSYQSLQKQTLAKHHEKAHLPEGTVLPFNCEFCEKAFLVKNSLTVHMKEVHLSKKKIKCEVCGQEVLTNSAMKFHMKRHTGEKPNKCPECDYRSIRKGCLDMHYKLVHKPDSLPKFPCNICGKVLKLKSSLKEHLLRHSDKGNFLCLECGKDFKKGSAYQKHLDTAHKESGHTCNLCQKKFSSLLGLQVHMRGSHT